MCWVLFRPTFLCHIEFGDKFGESLGGSQAPLSFWEVPGLPRKFSKLPRRFFGGFPGSSLTVELNSNPEVPRKFPKLPRKFPKLPGKFPKLPWRSAPFSGKPDTLSWLTETFSSDNFLEKFEKERAQRALLNLLEFHLP